MLRNGLVTALALLGLSMLFANVDVFYNIELLQVALAPAFWPVVVVALVFGLINSLLVPMVMRLFKKAKGAVLFALTLVVDAAALLLTARIAPNSLYIGNWQTALIIAALLALVGTLVLGRKILPERSVRR